MQSHLAWRLLWSRMWQLWTAHSAIRGRIPIARRVGAAARLAMRSLRLLSRRVRSDSRDAEVVCNASLRCPSPFPSLSSMSPVPAGRSVANTACETRPRVQVRERAHDVPRECETSRPWTQARGGSSRATTFAGHVLTTIRRGQARLGAWRCERISSACTPLFRETSKPSTANMVCSEATLVGIGMHDADSVRKPQRAECASRIRPGK